MSDIVKLMLFLLAMWILQGVLTYFQVKNYRTRSTELRKKGDVYTGKAKGRLREGCIVMLVVEKDGTIIDAEEMRGITVFSKFKTIKSIIGKSIYNKDDLLNSLRYKQQKRALESALEGVNS